MGPENIPSINEAKMLKSVHFYYWKNCWWWLLWAIFRLLNALLGVISLGRLTYDAQEEWLWNSINRREEKLRPITNFRVVTVGYFDWWTYSCLTVIDEILEIISSVLGILSFGYLRYTWGIEWLWDIRTRKIEEKRKKKCSRCRPKY